MSTVSPFIAMTLQELDENSDTWGSVLNVSALELLEDAIAGTATVSVTSANVVLNTDVGTDNNPHYRMMIMNVTGTPGETRTVTAPAVSKIYVVANNTGDDSDVNFIAAAGAGVTVPAGEVFWLYCDGTNILPISVAAAVTAATATSAADADALGGTASTAFAQKGVNNTYTRGQSVQRVALTAATGVITPNLANSNAFYYLANENFQLAAPTNGINGSMFSLIVEQDAGAPFTISFAASTFIWEGGAEPTLSVNAGDVDYLAFERVNNLSGGGRWVGSIIKGLS